MSEFDDTSDLTDDECRQLLRAVAHERDALQAEVERLRVDAEQWKQAVKDRRVLPIGSYYGPDDHVPERDATAHGIAIDAARGES